MKRITVPLIDQTIEVYIGAPEWKRFCAAVVRDGGLPPDMGVHGTTYECWTWLAGDDRNTMLHEASHITDYLMARIGSDCKEFRAYIGAWVGDAIISAICR